MLIGYLPTSDLLLTVRGVSRHHAAMRWIDGQLWVADLGSRNGTFVNGLRVQSRVVLAGDVLQFGPVVLRVEEVDPDDASLAITTDLGAAGPTESDTEWLPGAPLPQGNIELLRHVFLLLLDDPRSQPRVAEAFSLLAHGLEADGGALGAWESGSEPRILASWGELGLDAEAEDALAFFGEVQRGAEDRACFRSARLPAVPPVLCCAFRRPGAPLLALVLRCGSPRGDAPILAELFLRILDQTRARVALHDRSRSRSEGGSVAPPTGVVRGASPQMQAVYRQIRQMAGGRFPVLVTGETGVGKEHLVRLVHESSPRREAPFVVVNCAAIPADLLEAEMFGIGRGVASGVQERAGKFRLADGGALFLDEIGEMPLGLQAKLLRALEAGEVQPIGCPPVPIDVRVLAATNADLARRVASGAFRADLYYRISGCQLLVPPLRERPSDIPALVQHFLGRFCAQADRRISGVTVGALRLLTAHSWPGNVRELENEVRRLVYACAEGHAIDSQLVHPSIRAGAMSGESTRRTAEQPGELQPRVDELEESLIREALETSGNRSAAARLLGLSRNGLAAKMKRLGIRGPTDR